MSKREKRKKRNRTPRKQPSRNSSKEKTELQITPYLGLIERPKGGCFVFNQLYFSPVRADSSCEQVNSLLERIDHEGTSILSNEALDFLANHGILIPKENNSRPITEWTVENRQAILRREKFIIRICNNGEFTEKNLKSLHCTLKEINQCRKGKENLKVELQASVNKPYNTKFSESLDQVAKTIKKYLGYNDIFTIYLRCPIESLSTYFEPLSKYIHPSIIFSCITQKQINNDTISLLTKMKEDGFRPHLEFCVSNWNKHEISAAIENLANELGEDGFSFELIPAINIQSEDIRKKQNSLISKADLLELFDYSYSFSKINLSQFILYGDLWDKIKIHTLTNVYPCHICMGRVFSLNNDDPNHEHNYENIQIAKTSTVMTGNSLHNNYFGVTKFAKENCHQCPLRFFCGGVCLHSAIIPPGTELGDRVLDLKCSMRKRMLYNFLEDATSEEFDNKKKRNYRFISGGGNIELVSVEQA